MQTLQKWAKVFASLALVAIPVVAHSVYGAGTHVQMALSLITMALGVFGFTVAKPLIMGDPAEWQRTHKWLGTLGMLAMIVLPAVSQTTLGASPAVKLGLDLAASFLGLCGFVAVRPLAGKVDETTLRAVLPLLLIPALLIGGCAVLGRCELGTLPSAAGSVIAEVVSIALSGGNYEQQLEQAGIQAAETNAAPQFSCVVQAVAAWMAGKKGQISPDRVAAIKAFNAFLAKHPATACGPAPAVANIMLAPRTSAAPLDCRRIPRDDLAELECVAGANGHGLSAYATTYDSVSRPNGRIRISPNGATHIQVCDSGTEGGADACRPVVFNDDMPMTISVPSEDFWRTATPAVTLAAPQAP
jgi:hypothetical protein